VIESALRRILFLADADPATARRLGGLTNLNYLVTHNGERFVVRVPGEGTHEYIDRRAEATAARVASEAGVNAELLFFDDTDGLMVTRFIDGATTMDGARFVALDAVARAADVLRRLHQGGRQFATDFRLFPILDEYKNLLAVKRARMPDGFDDVQAAAESARVALVTHPVGLVACHCDPLCENFLDVGSQMFLIDYEYAANNDPMWDLGDLSIEGGFSADQDAVLLRAYFGTAPTDDAVARMVVYKAMADLLWSLWGVVQHVNANPVDDFWAYAVNRFERGRSLIESPSWNDLVAAIR